MQDVRAILERSAETEDAPNDVKGDRANGSEAPFKSLGSEKENGFLHISELDKA